jgi:hypothetical protein
MSHRPCGLGPESPPASLQRLNREPPGPRHCVSQTKFQDPTNPRIILRWVLDSGSTGGFSVDPDATSAEIDTSRGAVLLCAACRHLVTRKEFATEVSGRTVHTFTNPHGFTYTFRTFIAAPGCAQIGGPTMEHTWFPGYAWQMASCRGCREHLGWHFSSAAPESFYGLIDGRLIEDQLQ